MRYYDAHCHLQDERIVEEADAILAQFATNGIQKSVINGTGIGDWASVAALADRNERLVPFFGLHPWNVLDAATEWRGELTTWLDRFPRAGVGEIGLDRWMRNYDIDAQLEAFEWQMEIAAQGNRPTAIHCLQAWGHLEKSLRSIRVPSRGFMIHSYGGSKEMVRSFANCGAYFSISGYFALEKKRKQHGALRAIPLDRLLIETDAPDMMGPVEFTPFRFESESYATLNHPLNIIGVYRFVAQLFGLEIEALCEQVEQNFRRFFEES